MLNLDGCTRFHSDKTIIASYYSPSLSKCYIVTQESLKILDGPTHTEVSNFIFPFNGVSDSNLEQHKSLTVSPSTVSGRIINAHFYITSLSINLVLVFSLGWICHISNNVLLHIENMQESLSASAVFSYKNEYLLTVCSVRSICILTLESLSKRGYLSVPIVTSSDSRQQEDAEEHNYPVEVAVSWPLQAILYNTGYCSLYRLQDIDKHSLDLNLTFLGLLDLIQSEQTEKKYVRSLSNLSIVSCTHEITQSNEIALKSAYIYYLESSVRVDTMDLVSSIRTLTESGFTSEIRAMRVEFPSVPAPSAALYNISVVSPLSQIFLTSSANTLPTKILSLYATRHHLVLHLMDDSIAIYSIREVNDDAKTVSIVDSEAFQPIHRHMRSRLASKTYNPQEVEYIVDNDTTFDRHIVLDLRIKQLVNRSRARHTIIDNRVPFLTKTLGHAGTIMGVDDAAERVVSAENAFTISQIKFKPEPKEQDMLAVLYSSTVFYLPTVFLTAQGTPGLPASFLPEILTTCSMVRFGCSNQEDPGAQYLKRELDIHSDCVKETLALASKDSYSYNSIEVIPHPLLLPTQQSRDRQKYLSIARSIFPEQAFFLEEVARMVNDPFYLDNADYLVCMASLLAIFNAFRAEQRTLELRSYDAGIKSVMAAICATFPAVAVVKNRFIILPQKTKITAGYGFSTRAAKTNSFNVMLPAWDLLQHTVLSAKIFPLTLSGKQFLRVYRQLSHRSILSFVGCGAAINNAFYVFTEAPPKLKLSRVFQYDEEAIHLFKSERRIKVFIRSLLQAINFLYSNDTKLIHRDLRPNQIWVRKNNNGDPIAKIYHMGFMYPLSANEPVEHNTVWVAPEVVCGGIDIKSDVWSIGTIAFRLLETLVNLHQGRRGRDLSNLFCPSFTDISKVPPFAHGSGERSLLIANNSIVVYQMMLMSSDKVEIASKRYAIYTVKNCDTALEKAKVPWSMRRAYLASTGILPWHDLNYAKPGAQKEECGNLDTFFEAAVYSNIISTDAIDFIKHCWTFNLDVRPSPEMMLKHPWLNPRPKQLTIQNGS